MCGVSDFIANCKCDLDGFHVSVVSFQTTTSAFVRPGSTSYILQHFDFGTDTLDFDIIL
ncbi:hypothetical protein PDIG_40540 [Penicillium digitatum PHI26]|uniref:Uncharacterized protein n=2 Tax=Penicillium digitatum TaxID=36651 RepID=K9FTR7_PEND2|nr:hypothetical protein PDIP_26090 [Penicillium digitatum Pd1]EKV13030.1 hypothetical protein PDIG_40540 [Penicillium digitatum PHI26]EKV18723.1 hypothetical protein PDIP_26090 [Penicillium digitatum Pd1]